MSGLSRHRPQRLKWCGPERSDYTVTRCARLGLDGKGAQALSNLLLPSDGKVDPTQIKVRQSVRQRLRHLGFWRYRWVHWLGPRMLELD